MLKNILVFFMITVVFAAIPVSADDSACQNALSIGKRGLTTHKANDRRALEKARNDYQEALTMCPDICRNYPQICANLGHAFHQLGQLDEAEKRYKEVIRLHPEYGTPYFGLGELYLERKLLGFALDAYLKAYLVDRTDEEARIKAAQTFAQVCDLYKGSNDALRVEVSGPAADPRNLENRLLLDKVFSETNRRFFLCDLKLPAIEFILRSVTFETGTAVLKPEAYDQIKVVSQILRDHSDMKVILEGHTDSAPIGKQITVSPGQVCGDNICLSEARAKAVKQALTERFQIDAGRISILAYGDRRPLDPAKTMEAMAKNRRVTLLLDK
ncbi:MAG: OmpA family protein [Deltaproteobacteria bacterium]|nr:OmpA family protein [Deltaproteobacteria bacterium]